VEPTWLTLLSWNVHGLPFHAAPQRLRRIAGCIEERRPDLVLLQEIWVRGYLRLLSKALDDEYEAIVAPGRGRPRGGLALLLRRAAGWGAAAVSFQRYGAAAPWLRLHEGDGISGKGILAVDLRRGGERLVAVNTHLQAQYGVRRYDDVRRAQLDQLVAFVERLDAPLLLAGDLNTDPGDDLYRSHVAALGADLTAEERARRGGGTCFDRRGGKSEWIDYALLRGLRAATELTRIENQAPDEPYSDHDALLVRIASVAP
jgi:endonuclease/exonuclease/phosphatase family metal-dependent hydrolase